MKSNKKLGSDFEQEVCQELAKEGYWVHNFANRKNGQPADNFDRFSCTCLASISINYFTSLLSGQIPTAESALH